jgi:hypothetical protein
MQSFIQKTLLATGGAGLFDLALQRLWLTRDYVPVPARNSLTDPGFWSSAFPLPPGQPFPEGASAYRDFCAYHRPPILPPTALRPIADHPRWLPWAFGHERGKVPLHCHKTAVGSDSDSETWGTLEQANHRYRVCAPNERGSFAVDGIGLTMTGDGLWNVDFDCYKRQIPETITERFDKNVIAQNCCVIRTPRNGRRVFGYISDRSLLSTLGAQVDMFDNALSVMGARCFVTVTAEIMCDGELQDLSAMVHYFNTLNRKAGYICTTKPLDPARYPTVDVSHITPNEADPVIQRILDSRQAEKFKKLFYAECRDDAWMTAEWPRDKPNGKARAEERRREEFNWVRYSAWMSLGTIIKGFPGVPDDVAVSILQRSWMTCDGKDDALRGDLYSRIIAKCNEKNSQMPDWQKQVDHSRLFANPPVATVEGLLVSARN